MALRAVDTQLERGSGSGCGAEGSGADDSTADDYGPVITSELSAFERRDVDLSWAELGPQIHRMHTQPSVSGMSDMPSYGLVTASRSACAVEYYPHSRAETSDDVKLLPPGADAEVQNLAKLEEDSWVSSRMTDAYADEYFPESKGDDVKLSSVVGTGPEVHKMFTTAFAPRSADVCVTAGITNRYADQFLPPAVPAAVSACHRDADEVAEPTRPGERSRICKCGNALMRDSLFCRICGLRWEEEKRICQCGSELLDDSNFCRKCGAAWPPPRKGITDEVLDDSDESLEDVIAVAREESWLSRVVNDILQGIHCCNSRPVETTALQAFQLEEARRARKVFSLEGAKESGHASSSSLPQS